MGYSLSWVAIRRELAERALADLGLRSTGEEDPAFESPICSAVTASGWYVVVLNGRMSAYDGGFDLGRLSRGTDLFAGAAEEHVMFSGLAAWRNGQALWSIEHDFQQGGIRHVGIHGQPPEAASRIASRARAAQDAADAAHDEVDCLFEVPVELAKELTGYQYAQFAVGTAGLLAEELELDPSPRARIRRWMQAVRSALGTGRPPRAPSHE